MIILVTGGRDYADRERVFFTLDTLAASIPTNGSLRLWHGACGWDREHGWDQDVRRLRGADGLADEWFRLRSCPPSPAAARALYYADLAGSPRPMDVAVRRMPAHWTKLGNAAGPLRNNEMIGQIVEMPDPVKICAAFPGGAGTAGCLLAAKRAGLFAFQVL